MTEKKPVSWLYKKANIENYSDELYSFFKTLVSDINEEKKPHFFPVKDQDEFKKKCPNIFNKIKQWNLDKRLAEMAFIIIPPGSYFPIHRDHSKWEFRNIALLMPVLNCENSYTIMYDAEVIEHTLGGIVGETSFPYRSKRVNESQAKEIVKIPSNIPHWINVYQPHAPVVEHNNYRITFSMRFRPELFDLFENGIFDSFLVKN